MPMNVQSIPTLPDKINQIRQFLAHDAVFRVAGLDMCPQRPLDGDVHVGDRRAVLLDLHLKTRAAAAGDVDDDLRKFEPECA